MPHEDLSAGQVELLIDGLSDDVAFVYILQHFGFGGSAPPDSATVDAVFSALGDIVRRGLGNVGRMEYVDGGPAGRVAPLRHVAEPLPVVQGRVREASFAGRDWEWACWYANTEEGHAAARHAIQQREGVEIPPATMENVYLPDSWVLSVDTDATSVCFTLDAVVQEGHPLFYWPPKPGEQYPYVRLRWCLQDDVWWNEGPNLEHPATDASGEHDFGNIDAWWEESAAEHLEGPWGVVAVRNAQHTVTVLENA